MDSEEIFVSNIFSQRIFVSNASWKKGFGRNLYGICAVGDALPHTVPIDMGEGKSFKRLEKYLPFVSTNSGYRHSFLKMSDGSVYGYGTNYNCMLGLEYGCSVYSQPKELKQFRDEDVLKIRSNYVHSIALTKKGDIFTWGDNSYGQLGNGKLGFSCDPFLAIKDEGIDASAGNCHSLIVLKDGSLMGMGCNDFDQLGSFPINETYSYFVNVTKIRFQQDVLLASAGSTFSVILTKEGSVYFTGHILCDNGNFTNYQEPTKIFDAETWGGGGFKNISGGIHHFVALHHNGSLVVGFGCNEYNSLGMGAPNLTPFVMDISPLHLDRKGEEGRLIIKKIVAMNKNTMLLLSNGEIYYLGQNMSNPIFASTQISYDEFTRLPTLDDEPIIDMDSSIYHLTAVSETNVYCWGANEFYQCGNTIEDWFVDFKIPSSDEFTTHQITDISLNSRHGNAITSEGRVYSFGVGSLGQLGNGAYYNEFSPVKVKTENHVRIVGTAAAKSATVLVDEYGKVYSFGSGDGGCLGTGSLETSNIPRQVPEKYFNNIPVVDLKATDKSIIAMTQDHMIYVWGESQQGDLGLGIHQRLVNTPTPVFIYPEEEEDTSTLPMTVKRVAKISAGTQSMMALTEDNEVWEWGRVASESHFNIHYSPYRSFLIPGHVTLIHAGRSWNTVVVNETKLYLKGLIGTLFLRKNPIYFQNYTLFWEAPERIINCDAEYHGVCILEDGSAWGFGLNDFNQLNLNQYNGSRRISFQSNFTRLGPVGTTKFSKVRLGSFTTVLQEMISCFGYLDSEDGEVCGNRGICVDNDVCSCYDGFGGEECGVYACDSIASTDPSVCSGHGECLGANECKCDDGWGNYAQEKRNSPLGYCKYKKCPIGKSSQVCSGFGNCTYPENTKADKPYCDCGEEYRGSACQFPRCFNVDQKSDNTNPDGCDPYSTCVGYNNCQCEPNGLMYYLPLKKDKYGCSLNVVVFILMIIGIVTVIILSCGCCTCVFLFYSCICTCCCTSQICSRWERRRAKLLHDQPREEDFYEYPNVYSQSSTTKRGSRRSSTFLSSDTFGEEVYLFRSSQKRKKFEIVNLGSNHVFLKSRDVENYGTVFYIRRYQKIYYPVFSGFFSKTNGKKEGEGKEFFYNPEIYLTELSDWNTKVHWFEFRRRFIGTYHEDVRHGFGTEYKDEEENSKRLEGNWVNGSLLRIFSIDYPLEEFDLERDIDLGAKIGSGGFSNIYHSVLKTKKDVKIEVALKLFGDVSERIGDYGSLNNDNVEVVVSGGLDGVRKKMEEEENYDRFEKIGKILKRVKMFNHPNIVSIIGWTGPKFVENEFAYAMELCVGSVGDFCRKRKNKVKIEMKDKILLDCAKGMDCFHNQCGFIHRDLKLSNLLLDSISITVKICDFNLGLENFSKQELSETAVGSAFHCAPEIIRNEKFDHRCDVYSFGIMMYELYWNQVDDPFDIMKTKTCPSCGEEMDTSTPKSLWEEMVLHHKEHGFMIPKLYDEEEEDEGEEDEEERDGEDEDRRPLIREKKKVYRRMLGNGDWRLKLIQDCLQEDPLLRPDFQVIVEVYGANMKRLDGTQN